MAVVLDNDTVTLCMTDVRRQDGGVAYERAQKLLSNSRSLLDDYGGGMGNGFLLKKGAHLQPVIDGVDWYLRYKGHGINPSIRGIFNAAQRVLTMSPEEWRALDIKRQNHQLS